MIELLVLLAAAVVAVLIFTRIRLGATLGYLAAGAVIGPNGLALVQNMDTIHHIGELGVVFLLFLIGIEIKPQRLWVMRRFVFGFGGAQLVITGLIFSVGVYYALSLTPPVAVIMGFGLALSSTAFGVQILAERHQLTANWGRASFSVLLFQDLSVVPLLALVPMAAAGGFGSAASMELAVLEAGGIFLATLVGGHFLIGPTLKLIARTRIKEVFTAAALLLVLGIAMAMELAGLSMAMGAFIAGMLLSGNEFRHQIEADVEPFRGLLLGLFFMSVGMAINVVAVAQDIGLVIGGTIALMATKAALIFMLARLFRLDTPAAFRAAFLLSQSGEFGFILFTLADSNGVLPTGALEVLLSVVVLSMALTPLMMKLGDWLALGAAGKDVAITKEVAEREEQKVVIAGYGRVGETIGRLLSAVDEPWLAVDMNVEHVSKGRNLGNELYFGDASRQEILQAIGIDKIKLMVVTLDNPQAAEKTIRAVRRMRPGLPIITRARDVPTAENYAGLGVQVVPETVEASLQLGAISLKSLGVEDADLDELIDEFRTDNYRRLKEAIPAPAGE
ncbi:monovalent cation:proton antiporter-2 (CPA2) family protein [Emcibacter nanhaiensis]|uniref:Potassium transporter KefB n=1 Tax=Emcibacter nanhaiensis TaxID=1505037 RepID=A0A501PHR2_9PROT|nr:monovalent cation:proton antiporter-2 (CPA2) family protein [Emcibacter nanhaiensis]TPD59474.1 potassium transporter KefB [Emcibacter nanhaiensis]